MSYCHLRPGGYSNVKMFFGVAGESSQAVTTLMRGSYIEHASCLGTMAGPVVSSISPSSGSTAGSTPVTISGSGFTSPATVKIGGTSATSIVVVNATTITAHTPAGAAGAADVTVVVTGNQGMTLAGGFSYTSGLPPPTVASISPGNGSTLGGTHVTVTGTGFISGATVSIGGVAATSVVFVNATSLTAVTGAHATGTVGVTVTNPGPLAGSKASAFFYVPPATTTGFNSLTPCRILDTRNAAGPLGGPALQPNATRTFIVTGTCGVPSSAVSISANLTIISTAAGSLTAFPGNGLNPGTSSLSFDSGKVRANNAILFLATDGTGGVSVSNNSTGANNLILDVNGYFK